MPVAAYRSFVSLAKDSTHTTLSAAVSAGATTVPVVGTVVPASSTIFIQDGQNSESRAVTAGGGTSSLTVAALTNAHPANTYVWSQLTASVGPTDSIPVTSFEFHDVVAQLADKGYRGAAVEEYNRVQGIIHSEVTLGGDVYPDTIGYLLGGLFGATDFTGGTPNLHAFSVKNTGDTQPTPFVLYDYDGVNMRAFPGSKFEELTFKVDPAGLLSWNAKAQGWPSAVVATPTPSFSALTPAPSWGVQATIASTAVLTVISADVTIKRPVTHIATQQNVQSPYSIFLGPCSAEGKIVMVMEDDSQLANYLTGTKQVLDLNFVSGTGASQVQLKIHGTQCNFNDAVPKQVGKSYVELEVPFTFEANTTDATTAGTLYSPLKVTIANTKATGTYQ